MNKKNITLMVVAVLTLITFVGLATYAYFVGNINTTRTSNVTATTERNNLVFDTNGGAMQLNVSALNMQRAKNGTVAAQNSTTLTVNLTANTNYSMVCTYDIVYEWTSTDKYTAHSSGVSSNEFTIKASLASNSNTYEGTNNISSETDLSSLTYTNNSATVVSGAQIDATGSTMSTAVWTLESKIYNVNANQTNLVNKNFGGRFRITNVSCVSGNVTVQLATIGSWTDLDNVDYFYYSYGMSNPVNNYDSNEIRDAYIRISEENEACIRENHIFYCIKPKIGGYSQDELNTFIDEITILFEDASCSVSNMSASCSFSSGEKSIYINSGNVQTEYFFSPRERMYTCTSYIDGTYDCTRAGGS